jgi:hypothetical protein
LWSRRESSLLPIELTSRFFRRQSYFESGVTAICIQRHPSGVNANEKSETSCSGP